MAAAQPAPPRWQRSATVVALAVVWREVVPLAVLRLPSAVERRVPQAAPAAEEASWGAVAGRHGAVAGAWQLMEARWPAVAAARRQVGARACWPGCSPPVLLRPTPEERRVAALWEPEGCRGAAAARSPEGSLGAPLWALAGWGAAQRDELAWAEAVSCPVLTHRQSRAGVARPDRRPHGRRRPPYRAYAPQHPVCPWAGPETAPGVKVRKCSGPDLAQSTEKRHTDDLRVLIKGRRFQFELGLTRPSHVLAGRARR